MRRNPGAARAIAFIANLTHTSGPFAGQPFNLRRWQRRILAQLFETGKDGRRTRRTALLLLPRKNGKSSLAAACCLYALLGDGEISAVVVSAAADVEQAGIVFDIAVQMVRNDPELEAMCEIVASQRRIVHRPSGSVYKAISAEAYNKHGGNISFLCYDEIHAAQTRDLWDVLTTSMGARSNPITLAISTAGYDRHSILWELYSHAKKVQENPSLDPTFLPIIYEMRDGADWTDEREWKRCNPALGDFRSLADMRIACARAQAIPAQEMIFRRLFLNQWTESAERWVSLPAWDACRVDPAEFKGRRCYVGLDLSSTKDLTALVAVFPDDEGPGFDVRAQFFIPKDNILERVTRDRVPYDQWVRDGYLIATPGNRVDYEVVRRVLNEWGIAQEVRELAFDPWNATDLIQRLQEQDGFTCVPIRQGFRSLSAPTKALEAAILSKTLRHDGHPILRWCIGNAAAEQDATGNIKLSKAVSTERIDGASALVNAVDRMSRHGGADKPSFQMLVLGGSA